MPQSCVRTVQKRLFNVKGHYIVSLRQKQGFLGEQFENYFNHCSFSKRGFNVKSYGSGTHVKLPGSAADKPNIYTFNTTYQQMYDDLLRKDYNLYPEKSISRGKKFSACHVRALRWYLPKFYNIHIPHRGAGFFPFQFHEV